MEMRTIQLFIVVVTMAIVLQMGDEGVMGNIVFKIQNKFKVTGRNRSITIMRAHDIQRHRGRHLSSNIPLGGDSFISGSGLYFAKFWLGTPPKDYKVHVDTGSPTFWLNCAGCDNCPTKTDLGVKLHLYDPASSSTSNKLYCNDGKECPFNVTYVDKDSSSGFYVSDLMYLPHVTGNFETKSKLNATVKFGCATKRSSKPTSADLDGLIGFDRDPQAIVPQIAKTGKIKKQFAHCLNGEDGGGILALGEVVSPKVKTTPLVPKISSYVVYLKKVDVDGENIELPKEMVNPKDLRTATILDSGTTLTLIPDPLFQPLMDKILARRPGLKTIKVEEAFTCFNYIDNIDDVFPAVTFHFENSLKMSVYPHDYLFFEDSGNFYCFGWMNSVPSDGNSKMGMMILGDMVLQNKLVVHDLENDTVGWMEYDCSSSIKMKDEESGAEYLIGALDISSALSLTVKRILIFLSIVVVAL